MKKLSIILALMLCLTGCGKSETSDTTSSNIPTPDESSIIDLPLDSAKNIMTMASVNTNCKFEMTNDLSIGIYSNPDVAIEDYVPPVNFTYHVVTEGEINNNKIHATQSTYVDESEESTNNIEMYTQINGTYSSTVISTDKLTWFPSENDNELAAVSSVFENIDSFENADFIEEDGNYIIDIDVRKVIEHNMLGTFMTSYINQIFENNEVAGAVEIVIDKDLHLNNISIYASSQELDNIDDAYKTNLDEFYFDAAIIINYFDFNTVEDFHIPGQL